MAYRVLFMGTNAFASVILENLFSIEQELVIIGVVSQPDRPVGRKKIITPTPVKVVSQKFKVPILQPEKVSSITSQLYNMNIDIVITCAYGQILPQAILDLPRICCLNVHASLLPHLRGGAPIQWAIINQDAYSGISLMKMISKMDAGPVYCQAKVALDVDETYKTLSVKLALLAINLLKINLMKIVHKEITPIAQDEKKVSFAWNIVRNVIRNGLLVNDEIIDWNKSAKAIDAQVRGLYDQPIAYTRVKDFIFKIHQVAIVNNLLEEQEYRPGTIVKIDKNGILVATKENLIQILVIQPQGKTPIKASNYFGSNNCPLFVNLVFD